jgi:hypothetical protein
LVGQKRIVQFRKQFDHRELLGRLVLDNRLEDARLLDDEGDSGIPFVAFVVAFVVAALLVVAGKVVVVWQSPLAAFVIGAVVVLGLVPVPVPALGAAIPVYLVVVGLLQLPLLVLLLLLLVRKAPTVPSAR